MIHITENKFIFSTVVLWGEWSIKISQSLPILNHVCSTGVLTKRPIYQQRSSKQTAKKVVTNMSNSKEKNFKLGLGKNENLLR